jgi:predicted dehydrogenase
MWKVAITGAGYIGILHAKILRRAFKNVKISAVVDSVKEKGEKLADEAGAPFYRDFGEMLEKSETDVVAVCTPTYLHADMVRRAAGSKKHIFCEKPLALTVKDADAMIEAVEKRRVYAIAAHVLRFWPVYVRGKQIVEKGGLGRPVQGYCERLLTFPSYTEKAWNRKEALSGGVALDVQIHDLDYLSWLFGRPMNVVSTGIRKNDFGGFKHIVSNVTFKNGVVGTVQAGWGFPAEFPFTMGFRILCEKGAVEWSFRAGKLLEERGQQALLRVYARDGSVRDEQTDSTDPFELQWRYFLDCLEKGRKISNASFEDGRNALALALATIDSANRNRPVKLDGRL